MTFSLSSTCPAHQTLRSCPKSLYSTAPSSFRDALWSVQDPLARKLGVATRLAPQLYQLYQRRLKGSPTTSQDVDSIDRGFVVFDFGRADFTSVFNVLDSPALSTARRRLARRFDLECVIVLDRTSGVRTDEPGTAGRGGNLVDLDGARTFDRGTPQRVLSKVVPRGVQSSRQHARTRTEGTREPDQEVQVEIRGE